MLITIFVKDLAMLISYCNFDIKMEDFALDCIIGAFRYGSLDSRLYTYSENKITLVLHNGLHKI